MEQALGRERENLDSDVKAKVTSGKNHEDKSADVESRGGRTRSSNEVSVMEIERRGSIVSKETWVNQKVEGTHGSK